MKKSVLLPALLFSSLLLLNMRCEKDKTDPYAQSQESLPPYSAWGANTFGCTLNGKNWVAYTDYSFPKLMIEYFKSNGTFRIVAYKRLKDKDDNEAIELSAYRALKSDKYIIGSMNDTLSNGYCAYGPPSGLSTLLFFTNKTHTGQIQIFKLDTIFRIISGAFEADLAYYDSSSSDSIIHIRNGRFDVTY